MWEPPGRDALSVLRPLAEKSNAPCAWLKVAAAERTLGFLPEAERDTQRAGGTPPGVCR
ncbi:MAG: hypothetical protein NVS3B10_18470 [Polyangiales bacterium]